MTFHRTLGHVQASPGRYIYGTFIISGGLIFEDAERCFLVRPRELLIADSLVTCSAKCKASEQISFAVSEGDLDFLGLKLGSFFKSLPWRGTPTGALARLLEFVATNMSRCSQAEFNALFQSAACLLPLATGSIGRIHLDEFDTGNPIFHKVQRFVGSNLSDPALSACGTADEIGVTDRYIHKMFAARGTTFSAYVTARRLDSVRAELLSEPRRGVSDAAYRCGFNDISTFNKAFKAKFGCTPTRYRGQADIDQPSAE